MDVNPCDYLMFVADRWGPEEYCGNEAEEGSAFCSDHGPDPWEPDWDDRRKDLILDCE